MPIPDIAPQYLETIARGRIQKELQKEQLAHQRSADWRRFGFDVANTFIRSGIGAAVDFGKQALQQEHEYSLKASETPGPLDIPPVTQGPPPTEVVSPPAEMQAPQAGPDRLLRPHPVRREPSPQTLPAPPTTTAQPSVAAPVTPATTVPTAVTTTPARATPPPAPRITAPATTTPSSGSFTLGPYKPPKHPSKVNPKWWAKLDSSQKNRILLKYAANRKQYDAQRARTITEAQAMAGLAAAGQSRDLQLAQAITDSTAKVKSMMVERLQVWGSGVPKFSELPDRTVISLQAIYGTEAYEPVKDGDGNIVRWDKLPDLEAKAAVEKALGQEIPSAMWKGVQLGVDYPVYVETTKDMRAALQRSWNRANRWMRNRGGGGRDKLPPVRKVNLPKVGRVGGGKITELFSIPQRYAALKESLISEGKTSEEADAIVANIREGVAGVNVSHPSEASQRIAQNKLAIFVLSDTNIPPRTKGWMGSLLKGQASQTGDAKQFAPAAFAREIRTRFNRALKESEIDGKTGFSDKIIAEKLRALRDDAAGKEFTIPGYRNEKGKLIKITKSDVVDEKGGINWLLKKGGEHFKAFQNHEKAKAIQSIISDLSAGKDSMLNKATGNSFSAEEYHKALGRRLGGMSIDSFKGHWDIKTADSGQALLQKTIARLVAARKFLGGRGDLSKLQKQDAYNKFKERELRKLQEAVVNQQSVVS